MRSSWVFSCLAGMTVIGTASCMSGDAPARDGEPAPAYAAVELGGDSLSLADLRGQPVLLNVWATWCPPCREEMPALEAVHQELGPEGLRVVAVSIDARGDDAAVREFLKENRISFTILRDSDDTITRTFQMIGVPETFLIDREGRLVKRWRGKIDPRSGEVRKLIDAVMADA